MNILRKRWIFPLVCLILLGAILWGAAMWDYVEKPSFSHRSGFYDDQFRLEISSFNAKKIYFTLDGTRPDENAMEYTGPITITDATKNPNNYSMLTDVSAGFYHDLIREHKTVDPIPGYVAPDFLVDKCTVVRAVAVSPSGELSEETVSSYFVGQSPEDYGGRVVSLVTDPENLFDSKTGIYVTGDVFQEYMEAGEIDQFWKFWQTNYRMRGREWERPVYLEFFDTAGALQHSQNAGVRIHGGISRGSLPKSLNLYARMDYDTKDTFDFSLFYSGYRGQTITLNSGGNQTLSLFPDAMVTDMTKGLQFSTLEFQSYSLFINGEYWGFYRISEKFDKTFVTHNYGVQADNVVMIKNGTLEEGLPEDVALYKDMKRFFSENDMSVPANYEQACQVIDMENFLDYYATMIYIARIDDWPISNYALWRTREVAPNNPYSDGKWRWMLFDVNSNGMQDDNLLTKHNTLEYVIEKDSVFRSLWASPVFREAFEERILRIGQTCFASEKMTAYIQSYSIQMKPVLQKSWDRFYGKDNTRDQAFDKYMSSVQRFFNGRMETVQTWFAQE